MVNCQKKCEINMTFGLTAYLLKDEIKKEKDKIKKKELKKQLIELNEEYKKQWNELN